MESIYLGIVIFLFLLAIFDLTVGVSNDAVNFLNSAIGAKAASFKTIILIAAVGIFCGATMSNGMMEIARHGIFRPEAFHFNELMCIFLAVMVTDVVLPELFLVRWYKGFVGYFSADQWGYISVTLFILFLVMAALFFYSPSVGIKKTGFVVGIIAFFLIVGTMFFAMQQDKKVTDREYAIITTPSVTVKGAPDNSGTSLFLIHEGLKVRVVGQLGDWYNIRMADGNEGWVAKGDLEKI